MYLAIGASNALLSSRQHADKARLMDQLNGHVGLMEHIATYAPSLVVAYNGHEDHPGVFVYEVAEVVGASIVNALLEHGGDEVAARKAIEKRIDSHLKAFFA